MERKTCRNHICIWCMIFFVIGIVGNASLEPLAFPPVMPEPCLEYTRDVFAGEGEISETNVVARLMPSPVLREVDDFQAAPAIREAERVVSSVTYCKTLLFFVPLLVLLLGIRIAKRRRRPEGKKIWRFLVVTFIHRTDGKKRTCFEFQKDQNRRSKRWRLGQNIKYYRLMRRRKYSFI